MMSESSSQPPTASSEELIQQLLNYKQQAEAAEAKLLEADATNRDLRKALTISIAAQIVLTETAKIDDLSKLYNKAAWKAEAETWIERAKREDFNFGILFIDLTQFKAVNDTLGHDKGDTVITDVSEVLRSILRTTDDRSQDVLAHERHFTPPATGEAGRMGGDEFAVLVPLNPRNTSDKYIDMLTPDERLAVVASRVHKGVSSYIQKDKDLSSIGMDIAIGGAVYGPDMQLSQLLEQADKNMYDHKRKQHEALRQQGTFKQR